MGSAKGLRQVGYFDCPGGGQIVVQGGTEGIDAAPQPEMTGCHQPSEKVTGTEIPVACFAHGSRPALSPRPRARPHHSRAAVSGSAP